jgi:hypothetical protein
MRIFAIAVAAVIAAFAVPASASAGPVTAAESSAAAVVAGAMAGNGQVRVVVEERRGYQHRRHGRHARKAHWRKVCRTTWRNHRRVKNCRRVRYWRR